VIYDFVAIGGGAAGYFGAIAYAEAAPGSRVLILEKTGSVLGKVRISGGGRCNVTHACDDAREFSARYPRGGRQLIGPLSRWGAADTMRWFEERGVPLKVEDDGRVFPRSDSSSSIVDCLENAAARAGVEVRLRSEVRCLARETRSGDEAEGAEGDWALELSDGEALRARAVLLATGGTRNGAGERLAGEAGHRLVPAAPSLFSLKIADAVLEGLAGLSVDPVKVSIPGTRFRDDGPCLVTHWGLSGPAVLKLSAQAARYVAEREDSFELKVNWCGPLDAETVDARLQAAAAEAGARSVRRGIDGVRLPARLWKRLVETAGIDRETTWAGLRREARRELVRLLTDARFAVEGKSMNKDEFVTAGGVELSEVDFRRMESRIAPGLYFAGEVLDIDGVTGGFNFQAAWTTSRLAGLAASDRS
jgi:predicted Rossmann fold flavoprotein